jgi:hypothetical protein
VKPANQLGSIFSGKARFLVNKGYLSKWGIIIYFKSCNEFTLYIT